MIVNDNDAIKRLNSPMNLMNRLKAATPAKNNAMSLFGVGRKNDDLIKTSEAIKEKQENKREDKHEEQVETLTVSFNPFEKPQTPSSTPLEAPAIPVIDNILQDSETQIKLGLAHDNALNLLNASMSKLSNQLDDLKPDKLSAVVVASGKIVEGIRKERLKNKNNEKEKEVHYHFYTPQQKTVQDYTVIDVTPA